MSESDSTPYRPLDVEDTKAADGQPLTTDQVLERIGNMGLFQYRITFFCGLLYAVHSVWTLQPVFFNDDLRKEMDTTETAINMASSVMFVGWGIGAVMFGAIADAHGRLPLMLISTFGGAVAHSLITVSPQLCVSSVSNCPTGLAWLYVCKFAVGLALGCGGVTKYALACEWAPPLYRCKITFVMMCMWSGLAAVLAGLSGLMADYNWKTPVLLVQACVLMMTGLNYCFVLESPSFLVLTHQNLKARSNLAAAAKANGSSFDVSSITLFSVTKKDATQGAKQASMIERISVLLQPSLLLQTLVLWLAWFAVTVSYYGLSFAASSLSDSVYLNAALLSIADIVGYTLALLADYTERRYVLGSAFFIGGAALLISAGLDEAARLPLSIVGKIGLACAFSLVYVFASELFPLEVRGTGLGTCNIWSRFGGLLAPLAKGMPIELICILFGGLSAVSGIFCLFLKGEDLEDHPEIPEARGKFSWDDPALQGVLKAVHRLHHRHHAKRLSIMH